MTAAVAVREPEPTFQCLHEAVASALGWLGASDGQVLAALDAARVAGWPGHPMMDPICRWLAAAIPDLGVQLQGDRLRVWLGSTDTAMVPLPEPVRRALARVAAGEAAALLLDLQPPPLPGPDLQDAYPPSYLEQLYPLVAYPADEPAPEACAEVDLVDEQASPAAEPESPPARRQTDTVTIPAVSAAAGDRGGSLVRIAVMCGTGALAAFLLAAGGTAQLAGAAVAASWPGVATAMWLPRLLHRSRYPARHRPGYRPAHAARAAQ